MTVAYAKRKLRAAYLIVRERQETASCGLSLLCHVSAEVSTALRHMITYVEWLLANDPACPPTLADRLTEWRSILNG